MIDRHFYSQQQTEVTKITMPITAGMLVCSTYDDDGEYYRARVLGVENDGERKRFNVFYVDYGNTSWVQEKELQAIPEGFCRLPPYAVPCALSQVSWNEISSKYIMYIPQVQEPSV